MENPASQVGINQRSRQDLPWGAQVPACSCMCDLHAVKLAKGRGVWGLA